MAADRKEEIVIAVNGGLSFGDNVFLWRANGQHFLRIHATKPLRLREDFLPGGLGKRKQNFRIFQGCKRGEVVPAIDDDHGGGDKKPIHLPRARSPREFLFILVGLLSEK